MKLTRRDRKAIVYTVLGVPISMFLMILIYEWIIYKPIQKSEYNSLFENLILPAIFYTPIVLAVFYWASRFINKKDSE